MIEEKVISESNLETIKKSIKFLESSDPDGVILRLLKRHISINAPEEDMDKLLGVQGYTWPKRFLPPKGRC